jgi:hypothetical protein
MRDGVGLSIVTSFALKFKTDTGCATFFGQDPFTSRQRRIVTDVLKVTTIKFGAPVSFVISFESSDLSLHYRFK